MASAYTVMSMSINAEGNSLYTEYDNEGIHVVCKTCNIYKCSVGKLIGKGVLREEWQQTKEYGMKHFTLFVGC